MEIVLLLIGLLVGAVLGGLVGWMMRSSRVTQTAPEERPEVLSARHAAVVEQVRRQEAETRAAVQSELSGALASVDELRGALEASRGQHAEFVESVRRERATREQQEAGQTQVLKTIAPVAQQLAAMQAKVTEMEQQRAQQHGELAEQIRTTQVTVEESKRVAASLATVLTGSNVRGSWGETQLRTLVESAGLLPRVDFDTQASIEADSGARRPDMVINMPGGKQMAVDAKVPFTAYLEAHKEGIDPIDRQRLLVEHARTVRGHVDTLSGRAYWTGLPASPEFTVAYIPNDQLLTAALEADPSLMEYAFGRGVVLATPTNLWSILKTVAYTWRQDVLTADAKQLFDLGRDLYRRIVTMSDHAEKLRRSIERTVKDYNAFSASLETRVLASARKLDALDEQKVLGTVGQVEELPRGLTAGDFEVFDDLDRPELDLTEVPIDAEIIDESA